MRPFTHTIDKQSTMLFCCNPVINTLTIKLAVDPPTLDATRRCLENAEGILREAEERGTYMSVE